MMRPIQDFCCQNEDCFDYGKRNEGNLSFRGWSGKNKCIRMIYCRTCKYHFSERKGTVLEEARLPEEKVVAIMEHVQEGCGTLATSRLLKVGKNTVTRYIRISGHHAQKVHDEKVSFSPSDKRSTT